LKKNDASKKTDASRKTELSSEGEADCAPFLPELFS
jgi:hypothetical protein